MHHRAEDAGAPPGAAPALQEEGGAALDPAALRRLLAWRRDVRTFDPRPLAPGQLERLLETTDLAPSVGLSQPWRWVSVETEAARDAVRADFARADAAARADYEGEQAARYARLKLAGFDTAPVQLAVFVDPDPAQGAGLGRRTMPETLAYSAVIAVHTLWLAARAEGVGMGWVSIVEPENLARELHVPPSWRLIALLCLGRPAGESLTPELERRGWERRGAPSRAVLRR